MVQIIQLHLQLLFQATVAELQQQQLLTLEVQEMYLYHLEDSQEQRFTND